MPTEQLKYMLLNVLNFRKICGFCLERFPLPLGATDGLRYFIVALPEPSI